VSPGSLTLFPTAPHLQSVCHSLCPDSCVSESTPIGDEMTHISMFEALGGMYLMNTPHHSIGSSPLAPHRSYGFASASTCVRPPPDTALVASRRHCRGDCEWTRWEPARRATFTVGAVGQAFLLTGRDSVLSDVVLPSVGSLNSWVNPTSLSHRGPRKFSWELTVWRTGTISSGWCRAVLLAVLGSIEYPGGQREAAASTIW